MLALNIIKKSNFKYAKLIFWIERDNNTLVPALVPNDTKMHKNVQDITANIMKET